MIGFVMVGTNDLDKAIKFYDTLLENRFKKSNNQ